MTILNLSKDIQQILAGQRAQHEALASLQYHLAVTPGADIALRNKITEMFRDAEIILTQIVQLDAQLTSVNRQLLTISGELVGLLAQKPVQVNQEMKIET